MVTTSAFPIPAAGLSSDAISPVRTAPGGRRKSAMMRAASAAARCRGPAACVTVLAVPAGLELAGLATWLPQPASATAAQAPAAVSQSEARPGRGYGGIQRRGRGRFMLLRRSWEAGGCGPDGELLPGDFGEHAAQVIRPAGVAVELDGVVAGPAPQPAQHGAGRPLDQQPGVAAGAVFHHDLTLRRADRPGRIAGGDRDGVVAACGRQVAAGQLGEVVRPLLRRLASITVSTSSVPSAARRGGGHGWGSSPVRMRAA